LRRRARGYKEAESELARVVAMRFLVVGVVLRFVVFRGVVAVINMLAGSVVVPGCESGACERRQKQSHDDELAHARILTRTLPLSARP